MILSFKLTKPRLSKVLKTLPELTQPVSECTRIVGTDGSTSLGGSIAVHLGDGALKNSPACPEVESSPRVKLRPCSSAYCAVGKGTSLCL